MQAGRREVGMVLSPAQLNYLCDNPDTVITEIDGRGGLLVEQLESVGSEGSGVWIDADGIEHHSPGADFTEYPPQCRLSSELARLA